jgi:xylulokinase
MFIGIDLGTSAVKAALVDAQQRIVASAAEPLAPLQPRPLWSEDDPEVWWAAVERALDGLAGARSLAAVEAIGFSGQMHGALLLDAADRPVRPAILWNDGRASAEADALAQDMALQRQVGVRPMAGFTGPKLLWLARHEPEVLARTRHLLLPKDYIRLKLCGERATDVTDAAGTWLLDEARRAWSPEAVAACGIDPDWLPRLHESPEPAGRLDAALARRWGMAPGLPLAAGAGDAMAGGIGIGCIAAGSGFLSLGTSAQIFVADTAYRADPDQLVHSFCHAAPQTWCRMAALLNGASPLRAVADWLGTDDIGTLIAEVERNFAGPSRLLALPYLSGERTPHNDPFARGVIFGLEPGTRRADIVQAVLEGVAFSLRDGLDVLQASGLRLDPLAFIGGGTRSPFWARLIAAVLGVTLVQYEAAERGPAFGAARLARLAVWGEPLAAVVTTPPVERRIAPDPRLVEAYAARLPAFRALYAALRPEFLRGA